MQSTRLEPSWISQSVGRSGDGDAAVDTTLIMIKHELKMRKVNMDSNTRLNRLDVGGGWGRGILSSIGQVKRHLMINYWGMDGRGL